MARPSPARVVARALARIRSDGALWRRALLFGVERGPDAWVRYSPAVIGAGVGVALPWARERVLRNLRLVHGRRPAPVEALDVAAVFGNYGSCLAEALLLSSGRGYQASCAVFGGERYDAALRAGRGVVLATAHTAGWEVSGPTLHRERGADVMIVMQAERDREAQRIHDEARARAGLRVAHVGSGALDGLPLLRHLRGGGVVAVQIDRAPEGSRTRAVSLFGAPFSVPEGPLSLAALTGAPILTVFTRRVGFLRYEVEVGEPLTLPRRPTAAASDAAAQALADGLERFVRANPTQWFHFRG